MYKRKLQATSIAVWIMLNMSCVRNSFHAEDSVLCLIEWLKSLANLSLIGRWIWKPMHMQPIYRTNPFVTVEGNGRGRTNAYIKGSGVDVGADIFQRGLCLPSDNKMTPEQQDVIIEIIHRCFRWCRLDVHESVNRSTSEICRIGRACMRSVDKEMPYRQSVTGHRRYISAPHASGM